MGTVLACYCKAAPRTVSNAVPRDISRVSVLVIESRSGVEVCALQIEKLEVILVDDAIFQCAGEFCAPVGFISQT